MYEESAKRGETYVNEESAQRGETDENKESAHRGETGENKSIDGSDAPQTQGPAEICRTGETSLKYKENEKRETSSNKKNEKRV